MKIGLIERFDYPVHIMNPPEGKSITWWHNPTLCKDDKGTTWVAFRCHDKLPLTLHLEPNSPYRDESSFLFVGKINPDTFEVTGLKLIVPEPGSPDFILKHNIEDVRIFWRHDGLHGIGVTFPYGHCTQSDILIDYDNGTYRLIHDYGQPGKHSEKNWSPPEHTTEQFDFIYSQTQVVKYGKPRGTPVYEGEIHGGSQLLPYKDGWISIAHRVMPIVGLTWRWYMTIAQLHDYYGKVTHHSQYFDFGTGWRENLQESVEYISGAIWTKDQEELLLSLGVRDETCGFVKVPVSAFRWHKPELTFKKFAIDDKLKAIVKEHAGQKPIAEFVL